MITRITLRGPAGGKKITVGNDTMDNADAAIFLRMDIDMGFKLIGVTDNKILLEYYEGSKYLMGTHKRYTGPKPQIKKLAREARVLEVLTAATT